MHHHDPRHNDILDRAFPNHDDDDPTSHDDHYLPPIYGAVYHHLHHIDNHPTVDHQRRQLGMAHVELQRSD